MQCIECGRETKLYKNLCEDCFAAKKRFCSVPKVIDITVCNSCGARLRSKRWIDVEDTEEGIIESIKDQVNVSSEVKVHLIDIEFELEDKHRTEAKITCRVLYEDLPLTEETRAEVRIKYEQCETCSRMAASYFTAIIQLRAEDRPVSEVESDNCFAVIESEIEKAQKLDKTIFITKLEEIHGGFDIYLSNQNIAKKIVNILQGRFGGSINVSSTLTGQKDGKNVYRMTYLFRFSKYQPGDIVEIENKIAIVKGISSRRVEFLDLKSWNQFYLEQKSVKDIKILGSRNDYRRGQFISREGSEVQIMDLSGYKTHTVKLPGKYNGDINTLTNDDNTIEVYFFIHDDTVYLLS